jgi:hypothetical protein
MATKIAKQKITSQTIRENRGKDLSPKWDDVEKLTEGEFLKKFHEAMTWYRLEKSNKDLKPKVIDWMGRNGYEKSEIAKFKKTKDHRCSGTMGAIAACLIKGMPTVRVDFNNGKDTAEWLKSEIAKTIEAGKYDVEVISEEKKAVAAAPVITIQDRLRDAAGDMSEEIDYAIDSWIKDPESFDPKSFKMTNLLRGKGAKAAHARFIKAYFKSGHDELLELASGEADEQLREAYAHNSRKNVKKLIEFYESIITACDQIAAEAKVLKKPRAKKSKPAEEIVKKLKFKVGDDKLGITSAPPATLVGAMACAVYNVRTRKLGYYIALNSSGLVVKNSTLGNFTEKSVQKTLRKPEVQIKEFKDQNTQKRFETWFTKNVKTTETALNGRFNEETVILKVYK